MADITASPETASAEGTSAEEATTMQNFVHFDHTRLDQTIYHDLQTPKSCLLFTDLVLDYTNHIRANDSAISPEEAASLKTFVDMISEDAGWSLARQVVREFREPLPVDDLSKLPLPFRQVLDTIQWRHKARTQHPRFETVPKRERELAWQRLSTQLSYLAPDSERFDEAEALARRISSTDS